MPRSPEYNRSDVVEQAMVVFWERGYNQTSIGDLVDATGLQPGSLYAAFGSKKGVFLEVLEEYNRTFRRKIRSLGSGDGSIVDAIRDMLLRIVDDTVAGNDHRGCLSVNALLEMSQHDAEIAARLAHHNDQIQQSFADLLASARSQGDIATDKDTGALSVFLVNNIWGMRVMCRSKPERRTLTAIVDGVISALRAR